MKGEIIGINAKEKYYILSVIDGDNHILFFEELKGKKYIIGDIIEFESYLTKGYGFCAINTKRTSNTNFELLKSSFKRNQTVTAYVYDLNEGGYLVSFNRYKCFAPYSENYLEKLNTKKEIVNTYQEFDIIDIIDTTPILSKKRLGKLELEKLESEERKTLFEGQTIRGKVKKVDGFGVFVSNI